MDRVASRVVLRGTEDYTENKAWHKASQKQIQVFYFKEGGFNMSKKAIVITLMLVMVLCSSNAFAFEQYWMEAEEGTVLPGSLFEVLDYEESASRGAHVEWPDTETSSNEYASLDSTGSKGINYTFPIKAGTYKLVMRFSSGLIRGKTRSMFLTISGAGVT
jgi:hypothetical protein